MRPEILFLSWLALAPLLQESADLSTIGHVASLAFYVAPPFVFALWTFTQPKFVPALRLVDTLPVAFLLYVIGSLLLTTDDASAWMMSTYITIGIGVILYYFLAFGPIGSLSWEKITAVFLMACTLQAVMGIVDGLAGWNLWHDTRWREGEGLSRAVATLVNPGVLGAFVGMGVVLAIALLVWGGPERLRALALATIVLGLPAVFLTYTRAPILATIVAVVLVLATRSQTRLIALGSLVLAAAVLIASWGRISESAFYQERATNTSNIQARVLIQDWSLQLAAERPLFGWGFGSFDRVKNSAGLSSGEIPRAYGLGSTSHNTYLTMLVEFGGIGLALLIVPWLVITGGALRVALARPELRWFIVGSIAGIVVYVLVATTLDMRFFSFVPALPWLFLGLLRRGRNFGGVAASASR
jgi:O-antigen ligase